ncbi:hypothetical protein Tco_0793245 [Tanacetum coccineum]
MQGLVHCTTFASIVEKLLLVYLPFKLNLLLGELGHRHSTLGADQIDQQFWEWDNGSLRLFIQVRNRCTSGMTVLLLANKTGSPGERSGPYKPCQDSSPSVAQITLSFWKAHIVKVP